MEMRVINEYVCYELEGPRSGRIRTRLLNFDLAADAVAQHVGEHIETGEWSYVGDGNPEDEIYEAPFWFASEVHDD